MARYRYFSTFISGSYDIVKNALKAYFEQSVIEFYSQDLILFTTDTEIVKAGACPFLNNTFLHIKQFNSQKFYQLDNQISWALERETFVNSLVDFFGNNKFKFRLVFSRNNQTVSVGSEVVAKLEEKICYFTNLKVHKIKPDYEIWFMEKREGYGICGIRISKHPDYQEVLARGELRTELAYLMNFLSEPNSNDVFWDPFCGNGALGISRIKYFPYKQVICSDINLERIQQKLNMANKAFKNFYSKTNRFS